MGKAAPNTSLPPQATNTLIRSSSQRGKYPFWVPWGLSRLTHFLTSHHPAASRKDINMAEFAVASGDQSLYRSEDIRLGEETQGADCGSHAWDEGGTSLRGPHLALFLLQITKTTS